MKKLIGLVVVVLLFSNISCKEKEKKKKVLRPVKYQTVYARGGEKTRTFSGIVQPEVESKISFKVPGTLKKLFVKVGDKVKKGELIAELDNSDYKLQAERAEAGLQQAKAQARNASSIYDRVRALYINNNASRNDLDGARAAHESANAMVRSVEKQLELALKQLSYTRLNAPVDGEIAALPSEINENVAAGMPIAILNSAGKKEVKVSIPEQLITLIHVGDSVTVSFETINKNFEGTITEVGVASVGYNTTFPVTVLINENIKEIRSGMVAEISFHFKNNDKRDVFIIPSHGVIDDQTGTFVFVVKDNKNGTGIVKKRFVTIGNLTNDGIEILSGLKDGDNVVTAGLSELEDNMKVKFKKQEEAK